MPARGYGADRVLLPEISRYTRSTPNQIRPGSHLSPTSDERARVAQGRRGTVPAAPRCARHGRHLRAPKHDRRGRRRRRRGCRRDGLACELFQRSNTLPLAPARRGRESGEIVKGRTAGLGARQRPAVRVATRH